LHSKIDAPSGEENPKRGKVKSNTFKRLNIELKFTP